MALLHGHPPAAAAYEFHSRQFIRAHMFGISFRCTTKTAFAGIAARVAQMSGIAGDGTAIFTCVGHDGPPLVIIYRVLIVEDS
jgi:hypothetical protein